ncbi:hypothetical protein [Bifidobacterium margollesii]|uniref:hypothetical protein n=1 Tax=Bifidobacterium margollesii TaxID=2020964 RepID=UPI00105461C3|nr:hypothetical protein [Bifidobacterium margollesii]
MDQRHHARLGRRQRPRPKTAVLLTLHQNHHGALAADWLNRYHLIWKPIGLPAWLNAPHDAKPRGNIGIGLAWELTREILRDHTSSSFAALAGWSYTPTGSEIAMWDRMDMEKRLRRHGWRPWKNQPDPLRAKPMEDPRVRAERLRRRRLLRERFHITE